MIFSIGNYFIVYIISGINVVGKIRMYVGEKINNETTVVEILRDGMYISHQGSIIKWNPRTDAIKIETANTSEETALAAVEAVKEYRRRQRKWL